MPHCSGSIPGAGDFSEQRIRQGVGQDDCSPSVESDGPRLGRYWRVLTARRSERNSSRDQKLDLSATPGAAPHLAFQKRGMGLLAISKTINTFGESCGLVAMKPFPLQFRSYRDPAWSPPAGVVDTEAAFEADRKALQILEPRWLQESERHRLLGVVPSTEADCRSTSPEPMPPVEPL